MRVSVVVGVLVVTMCLMVLGATQVLAQTQCAICGRVTTMVPVIPGQAAVKAPHPTCATAMQSCPKQVWMTPTVVTTAIPVVVVTEVKHPKPVTECANMPRYGQRRTVERPERLPTNECTGSFFNQLHSENDQVRTLTKRLASAQECQIADLYAQLRAVLVPHIKAQQAVLHSALLACPTTRDWTLQSAEAQQSVLTQLCMLDQTAVADDLWKIRFDNLNQIIGRSNFIEEEKLWPLASSIMNPCQCDNVCAAYNQERAAVLASLPTYTAVASTTFYPANCFVNRTMPTSSIESTDAQQQK